MAEDEKIEGGPTKRFFVSMLTRDISLKDAILDLVDNCVDGAMRELDGNLSGSNPYAKFFAKIEISPDKFEIVDNCGGISPAIRDKAFALGRPDIDRDGTLPTVGMYGIGMKRAIFKMGKSASVASRSSDGEFTVDYTEDWMEESNNEWQLPVTNKADSVDGIGTKISINKLINSIGRVFSNDGAFVHELREEISKHYGYIIEKGFSIFVNEEIVEPITLKVWNQQEEIPSKVSPFIYQGQFEGVNIYVAVGFHRPPPKANDTDDAEDGNSSTSSDQAGVSIVCNDRVVLLNDKTRLTGWGEKKVPKFHTQYNSISGIIVFSSNNAEHLPLTTTKRGIDQEKEVYWLARDQVMEGLKIFIEFTNKWKGREQETTDLFRNSTKESALNFDIKNFEKAVSVRGDDAKGKKFVPTLPMPSNKNPMKRISFLKPTDQIRILGEALLDDANAKPSDIGSVCFDRALKEEKE